MDFSFREMGQMLDSTIDSVNECVHSVSDLLNRENNERQSPILRKLIDVLGKWDDTPPAIIFQELEDIKKTCCDDSTRANVSGTSESFVGTEEMAKILDMKKNWLYQRTRLNKIPFEKFGKYNRFYPSKVIKFLQQKKKGEV